MTELPEVIVADRAVEAEFGGSGAVTVVQFEAAVQGRRVLYREVDIDSAGEFSGAQGGSHPAVGKLVHGEDVAGDVVEIDHLAFGHGGGFALDLVEGEIAGTLDAEPAHGRLGDLQDDHPSADLLGRDLHRDGLVTLV